MAIAVGGQPTMWTITRTTIDAEETVTIVRTALATPIMIFFFLLH